MTVRKHGGRRVIALAFALCALESHFAPANEPRWTRVLSGEPVGGPIAIGNRVVTSSDDRSITCIDHNGAFLWSGRLPGKSTPFLSALSDSYLCAVSEPGVLSLYGADGNLLWRISGAGMPVSSPVPGRDGRFFVPYRDAVRCFAINGLMLWSVSLPARYTGPVGETGDGDILVGCEGNLIARITPFGDLKETVQLTAGSEARSDRLTALAPVGYGFAAGYDSGYLEGRYVKDSEENRASEAVWSIALANPVRALAESSGTLIAALANGSTVALNATDGTLLWSVRLGVPLAQATRIARDYGQFNVISQNFAYALSDSGTILWSLAIPSDATGIFLAPDGSVYATSSGWKISAWTGERRIRSANSRPASSTYGVLANSRILAPWLAHPDTSEISVFFNRVTAALSTGTGKVGTGSEYVGVDEVEWASKLAAIIANRSFGTITRPGIREGFFDTERARAASLLGQLGSSEYRDFLIAEANRNPGETLSLGLLYGLAATGGDAEGLVASAVGEIGRKAGTGNDTVNRAVCDALYALIRYASGEAAASYARALVGYTRPPYGESVREYARQVLGNIVQ